MAITIGGTWNSGQIQDQNTGTITRQHTVSLGTKMLVVQVPGYDSAAIDVTSVTYNGVEMTMGLKSIIQGAIDMQIHLYYLEAPPTGTEYDIVVTHTVTNWNDLTIIAIDLHSPNDIVFDAVGAYASNSLIGGVITEDITVVENAFIIDMVRSRANVVGGITPEGTQTNIVEVDIGGSVCGTTYKQATVAGVYSMEWTTATGESTMLGMIAFKEDIGAGNDLFTASSTLTFSQNGNLKGKGILSVVSALNFSETSTLFGKGTLSGSTGINFANSNILKGKGKLSGGSQITFSEALSLFGKGIVSGSANLDFTGNAVFLLPNSFFTASANLGFTTDVILKGKGILAGATQISFNQALTLLGKGKLSGTTALVFDSNIVFVIANGLFTASSTLNFSNTVLLTGKGQILGSTGITFISTVQFLALLSQYIKIYGAIELTETIKSLEVQLNATSQSKNIELVETLKLKKL